MKVKNIRLLSVLLISLSLLYNSCTIVGLGIGAIVDSSRPDPENKLVNREDYETIKRDKEIIVHLKDNSSKESGFYKITEGNLILRTKGVRLPLGIRIRRKIDRIKLNDILSVEIKVRKLGKRHGALIGVSIDVLLIILIGREVGPCLAGAC